MNTDEIRDRVGEFLTEELEINPSKLYGDSRLKEDMGIDSLEVVDIVVLVEQAFGFRMKAEDFRGIKTLDELCSFIASRI